MRIARSLTIGLVPAMLVPACLVQDPPSDPPASSGSGMQPGGGSDSGPGPGTGTGPGSGGGSGGGNSDAGVPPVVTTTPSISQQSVCGGTQPVTLTQPATSYGCSLAAGTTSRCPAPLPAGKSLDALYTACLVQANQSDCQLTAPPLVECPVGEYNGPLSVVVKPPAGQAGYGFEIDLQRVASGGSIAIQWQAWELGVRADGSIAWQGPPANGQTAIATTSCCDLQYLAYFPGSGLGEKIHVALQWF